MSVLEAKKVEIHQIIDRIPETVIDDVLAYLQDLEKGETVSASFANALDKVMKEDYELLQRLAQ